jgi:hypothetical protein
MYGSDPGMYGSDPGMYGSDPGMYGSDPDEEPAGAYRRMPPRRNRPREAFDAPRGSEYPAATSADGFTVGRRRRLASRSLRSAGRRVVSALGWVGVLVIGPLFVGILAGAAAGMMHL